MVDAQKKGVAMIMNCQALDILAENDLRLVILTYPRHILKQGAAAHAFIIVFESHMLAGHRESLARKPSQTYIKAGNLFLIYLSFLIYFAFIFCLA